MKTKICACAVVVLVLIVIISGSLLAAKSEPNHFRRSINNLKMTRYSLAGAEKSITYDRGAPDIICSDPAAVPTVSPGMPIGCTTYDLQSNSRMQRQVDWRASYFVHFVWTKQTDDVEGGDRGTAYEAWDTDIGNLVFKGPDCGGCEVHPRLGYGSNYSGYCGLDIDTEDKVVIHNHHTEGGKFATTIWYDFSQVSCFFSPYRARLSDETMMACIPPDEITTGEYEMIWPQAEYQVHGGDTVTHVFAMQYKLEFDPALIAYYRRVGSDTLGTWDYPPLCIDTVPTIAQCVTASRTSGKVALIWQAPPGAYPGDPESMTRDWLDPGLGVNQRINDIFYMISFDMGASWGPTVNMTAYDSTQGGYLAHGDMSVLIDTDDYLHVLWPARVIQPTGVEGGLGEYTSFFGSRMLHWDELNNQIRTVKEANWDITEESVNQDACTGGAWNEMSLVKPMISECEGKFYAFFIQFLDLYNGIYDDCAEARWDGSGSWSGTANGEIYMSVSNNGGYNWDVARNLTNTYTPHCYKDAAEGLPVCESDHYVSVSRYGMYIDPVDDPDFFDAVVVIPEGGTDNEDYYLDVQFVNDKYPGSCVQDDGVWSCNAIKWFRVPCCEPVPNPVLVYYPWEYGPPNWTKPNVMLSLPVTMENVGNAPLTIFSVDLESVSPGGAASLSGFTSGVIPATDVTEVFNIDILYGFQAVVTGTAVIHSDHLGDDTSEGPVLFEIIVADTVQPPEYADIRTESQSPKSAGGCIRMTFNNAGNIGNAGKGEYNLDYFEDCDITGNQPGDDDRANVYMYDASPFICRIIGGDTIMYHYMFDAYWLTEDGFMPQEGLSADSTTYQDYQYGYTGRFVTPDTQIAVEVEYFAPKTEMDSCDFIVMRQKICNLGGDDIFELFIGDAMDWDIPTDSASNNQSDYDATRMFMWQSGYEYAPDSITNDDCVLADQRCGGYAYYGGFRLPEGGPVTTDSIGEPHAMWTENNADWVYPDGDFVGGQIWEKCTYTAGYETWEATGNFSNPDSMATDLHMVCVFGQFDLGFEDTLVFVKILASEYNGGEIAITETIDKARAWIGDHPEIFTWPGFFDDCQADCCEVPGDINHDSTVNILDITYFIAWLYLEGPPPPCCYEADANANCGLNILDITYLIAFLYQGGPAPFCADWCPPDGCHDWCY